MCMYAYTHTHTHLCNKIMIVGSLFFSSLSGPSFLGKGKEQGKNTEEQSSEIALNPTNLFEAPEETFSPFLTLCFLNSDNSQ